MTLPSCPGKPYPDDLPSLTSLRFYAAGAIVAFHCFLVFKAPLSVPGYHFFSRLNLGGDFFFILSGFILTHVYRHSLATGEISRLSFYGKRLARIYPLHFLTLLLAAGLHLLFNIFAIPGPAFENDTFTGFLANLFLIHAWLPGNAHSYNSVSWSISAEWFAYILFPFLLPIFLRSGKNPSLKLLAAASFLGAFFMFSQPILGQSLSELSVPLGIFRIFPEFIFGMALYEWGRTRQFPYCKTAFPALVALLIASLVAEIPSSLIVIFLLGPLILTAAAMDREKRKTILHGKNSVWLGEISYALYMIHVLIINLFFDLANYFRASENAMIVLLFLAPLLSISAAAFLHRFVELPGRRTLNALFHVPLQRQTFL